MGNKVTIPAEELADLFQEQDNNLGTSLERCEIVERTSNAKMAGTVESIREIADDMRRQLTYLIYQFDDPETKGETHVMPKQDEED